MKYWRGYLTAALFAALAWALTTFAKAHTKLIDAVYPYFSRLIQTSLADWTATAPFCLWQLLLVVLGVGALASIVAVVVLRWNIFQWFGWILAICTFVCTLHVGVFGLNYYAGDLADDIRLETQERNITDLVDATTYYLSCANDLADQVPRKPDGSVDFPTFSEMAEMAGEGFNTLVHEKYYAVFSGSTVPVKELGWADMYTSMGITGFTMSLTGEAAVNPMIPAVSIPFTMCHEMCHRMCIAIERDANMGAFLACDANSDISFRYSGYFMAFRYCYNALVSVGTATSASAASEIYAGINQNLLKDLNEYKEFFATNKDDKATDFANTVNDVYLKSNGDEEGVESYSNVSDLLVDWYIQEIYLPQHQEEVIVFDPTDKNQVDLSDGTEGNEE